MGHESHVERPRLFLLPSPAFWHDPDALYEVVVGVDVARDVRAALRFGCGGKRSTDGNFTQFYCSVTVWPHSLEFTASNRD
jgi:hypothetical protein